MMPPTTDAPRFTVFIPAYNRAATLPRLLDSLASQTLADFECIVVDDGSTDETSVLMQRAQAEAPFPLRYYHQPNSGKHVARNLALSIARGELFVTVDSDDLLMPDALARMLGHWLRIPADRRDEFAGVEGLCQDLNTGTLIGTPFPLDVLDADHLTVHYVIGVKGDKTRCVRTAIFRAHPYPTFAGERFIAESTVWNRIAIGYRFRYVNDVFVAVDYQPDGLSSSSARVRARNPRGAMLYYHEFLTQVAARVSLPASALLRAYANWVRYAFHSRNPWSSIWRSAPRKTLLVMCAPVGFAAYVLDRMHLMRHDVARA